jgi:hypothetical protein
MRYSPVKLLYEIPKLTPENLYENYENLEEE